MRVLERYEPIVDDPDAFLTACETPLPYVVRVNTIKASPTRVKAAFDEHDTAWTPITWSDTLLALDTASPGNTWPYFLGWVHGQEAASTIPVHALDPSPGDTVWDACAAPGSKTTQLADAMNDTGLIVANDDNPGRLAALRANTERLGITNTIVTNQDARHYSLRALPFDAFDATLVDAPCSGEGTVRKNPSVLDDWSEEFLHSITRLQTDLLRRAVQATRPGGTVVYSTCTFAPEENEAVVDRVLHDQPCRLVDPALPIDTTPGVTRWQDDTYDPSLERAVRIYPHHHDTGGFFCAKLSVQ